MSEVSMELNADVSRVLRLVKMKQKRHLKIKETEVTRLKSFKRELIAE